MQYLPCHKNLFLGSTTLCIQNIENKTSYFFCYKYEKDSKRNHSNIICLKENSKPNAFCNSVHLGCILVYLVSNEYFDPTCLVF